MTMPMFPLTMEDARVSVWDVSAAVPRSAFEPEFGPPIGRPLATAMDEVAQVVMVLMPGNLPAFRSFWAVTARGGPFLWHRPDLDAAVIVTPRGGYQQRTILGRRPGQADELVEISFAAFIEPAPVPE